MKHKLKAKYYIRYSDDFVILSDDKKHLENIIPKISEFLGNDLKLKLHPDKVFIKTYSSGVDFLGMVSFCDHRILRTKTKKRMFKKIFINCEFLREEIISEETFFQSLESYKGILKYCNGYGILKEIRQITNFQDD